MSRASRATIAFVAIAAVLLLALRATTSQAAPSSTATTSSTASVSINNYKFHPPTLTVKKGTKVTFSNDSGVTHTATDGGVFDTGHIKPGQSIAVRFTQKGTFKYHCKIHTFMHGTIVVR